MESDDTSSNIRSKDSDSISLKAYKDSLGEDAAFEMDFGSKLQGYTPESFGGIQSPKIQQASSNLREDMITNIHSLIACTTWLVPRVLLIQT